MLVLWAGLNVISKKEAFGKNFSYRGAFQKNSGSNVIKDTGFSSIDFSKQKKRRSVVTEIAGFSKKYHP